MVLASESRDHGFSVLMVSKRSTPSMVAGMEEPGSPCEGCAVSSGKHVPPGGSYLLTSNWSIHARNDGAAILVLQAVKHVAELDALGHDAALELGVVLTKLSQALIEITGCERVYVGIFNESRPHHLHVHVKPRFALDELLGPESMAERGTSTQHLSMQEISSELASRTLELLRDN